MSNWIACREYGHEYGDTVDLPVSTCERCGTVRMRTKDRTTYEYPPQTQYRREERAQEALDTRTVTVKTPCCGHEFKVAIADAAMRPTYDCPKCGKLNIITNDPEPGASSDFNVWMHERDSRWPVDGAGTGWVDVGVEVDPESDDITYRGGTMRAGEDF